VVGSASEWRWRDGKTVAVVRSVHGTGVGVEDEDDEEVGIDEWFANG